MRLVQLPPCSWEAGSQSCSLPALERFLIQDIVSPRFRLAEPRDEFVCFKQTSGKTQTVSGGPGWPTALWKQWPSDSQKIHQQACSSPAASRSHPCRLDSMLSVKRTSHPSKLAPLHPPTPQACPTGLPAAGRGTWSTPDPINHHIHPRPRQGSHWKDMCVKSRLGRQVFNCGAGLLGDTWRSWGASRISKAT